MNYKKKLGGKYECKYDYSKIVSIQPIQKDIIEPRKIIIENNKKFYKKPINLNKIDNDKDFVIIHDKSYILLNEEDLKLQEEVFKNYNNTNNGIIYYNEECKGGGVIFDYSKVQNIQWIKEYCDEIKSYNSFIDSINNCSSGNSSSIEFCEDFKEHKDDYHNIDNYFINELVIK
jgi:hypothetical protein